MVFLYIAPALLVLLVALLFLFGPSFATIFALVLIVFVI